MTKHSPSNRGDSPHNYGDGTGNYGVLRQMKGQHLELKLLTWVRQVGVQVQPQTLRKCLVIWVWFLKGMVHQEVYLNVSIRHLGV